MPCSLWPCDIEEIHVLFFFTLIQEGTFIIFKIKGFLEVTAPWIWIYSSFSSTLHAVRDNFQCRSSYSRGTFVCPTQILQMPKERIIHGSSRIVQIDWFWTKPFQDLVWIKRVNLTGFEPDFQIFRVNRLHKTLQQWWEVLFGRVPNFNPLQSSSIPGEFASSLPSRRRRLHPTAVSDVLN